MPKGRRYSLRSSEAKALTNTIGEDLGTNLSRYVDMKANIEVVEVGGKVELFLFEKKPILFRTGERVYPTLLFTEAVRSLPKAVVDMGAVSHVCNGADIMAPGIVRFEGEFLQGHLIVVVDVKHGKPLALGEAIYDSEVIKLTKKGVVIKNVHFVGDEVWNAIKATGEYA
jgi:PUA-domain protein